MTAQNRTALKALFETGDTITQTSMSTLIDSFLDIAEVSSQTVVGPIVFSQAITVNNSGTIIPVSAGGTGLIATSAYSILCGGTTNAGNFQAVSTQGTNGQVLTSNGANALPTWQNAAVGILSTVYPVGSYYLNETDSTNPATLFGFGTWVAVTDKFIVAHGSTYTSTGGAATVTLAQANLPNVQLGTGFRSANNSNTTSAFIRGNQATSSGAGGVTTDANTAALECLTQALGSGTAFSIIPTYQAVYIWKRTV